MMLRHRPGRLLLLVVSSPLPLPRPLPPSDPASFPGPSSYDRLQSDALNQSTRGAFGPGLGHVPFLRSGLLAAHQGFGLQSELSRAALPARLAPAVASGAQPPAVSPRTRSAVHGLHLAMDLTRSAALQGAEEEAEAQAEALHVLAEAEAAVAAVVASRSAAAVGAPGRSSGVAGAGALAEAAAAAAAEELEDELLLEESDQGGLLEALDWQERLRHENLGERLSAARSLRARRQSLSAAKAAGAAKPRSSRLSVSCPTPAASEEVLLEALSGVPGLQVTEKMVRGREGRGQPGLQGGATTWTGLRCAC